MLSDNCLGHTHTQACHSLILQMDLKVFVPTVLIHSEIFNEPAFSLTACDVHFNIGIFY